MRLLFILSVISVVQGFVDLVTAKPIPMTYFGSGFPQNAPIVWHFYGLAINVLSLWVYIKRSYSLLKIYTYISVVTLTIAAANSTYQIFQLPEEQRVPVAIVYGITYILGSLILVYLLGQKKYFNKP